MDWLRICEYFVNEILGDSFWLNAGLQKVFELLANTSEVAGSVAVEDVRDSLRVWQTKSFGYELGIYLSVAEGGNLIK